MCLAEEELANHLFVHHRWFSPLWHLSFSLMGISWVQPQTIKDVLMTWRRRLKKSWILAVWNLLLFAIWGIWRERNSKIFQGKGRSFQDFQLYFLRTLYSRSQVLSCGIELTFLDFFDMIIIETLRAWCCFVIASFCISVTLPSCSLIQHLHYPSQKWGRKRRRSKWHILTCLPLNLFNFA